MCLCQGPESSTPVSDNSDRPLRVWWHAFMFAVHSVLAAMPARIVVERGAEATGMAWVRIGFCSMVDLGMEGEGSGEGEGICGWLLAEEVAGMNGLITVLSFSARLRSSITFASRSCILSACRNLSKRQFPVIARNGVIKFSKTTVNDTEASKTLGVPRINLDHFFVC